MLFKFHKNDITNNTIETYPNVEFIVYDRRVYYNNTPPESGSHTSNIGHINIGNISLHEINVDRDELIYPFVYKDSNLSSFNSVSVAEFNEDYSYGDTINGSYPLSASISKDRFSEGSSRNLINALRNTLDYNKVLSPHYAYSSSYGKKEIQELGLLSIPSIFYGSSIKKGTVNLKFYVSGTLIGQLADEKRNGELIQTFPSGSNGSGSVAGIVLYKEGFLVLTGAWDISNGTHTEPYIPGESATSPKWIYFASTGSTGANENLPSSSFYLTFNGNNKVPVMTMLAHAPKGQLNHSNNLTYISYGQEKKFVPNTSSVSYRENNRIEIKNINKTIHSNDYTSSFEKITYISSIGIYDENKDLIAIAKLAKPLRKREKDQFSFRLKVDF